MPATNVETTDGPGPAAGTRPRRSERAGVPVVSWDGPDGCRRDAADRCPHRRAPLSSGTVEDGVLRCPYHGWAFDGDGACVDIPAIGAGGRIPARARLEMLAPEESPTPAVDPGNLWLDGDTPGLEWFWHPVARASEIAPGDRVTVELLGRSWSVGLDGDDVPTAHGDDGQPAAAVALHLDHVWIAPLTPLNQLPDVAEWGLPDWHHRRLTRAEGRLGVGLLLDNQLDSGHFAWVHRATFGRPETALIPPAEIVRDDLTVSTSLRVPIAARNDRSALDGVRTVEQHRTMHYEFHAPLWLRLQLDYEELGGSTIILFSFVPLGRGRARVDADLLFFHPEGFTEPELDERMRFEETVVGEDLALQRLFDDLRLPLDQSVELHTKADRYSLACRDLIRTLLLGVDQR